MFKTILRVSRVKRGGIVPFSLRQHLLAAEDGSNGGDEGAGGGAVVAAAGGGAAGKLKKPRVSAAG